MAFGFFTAIRRIFIRLGLLAEQATETAGFNIAVIDRGIRDSKQKAEETLMATGKIKATVALLMEQIKKQERREMELQACLKQAAETNDEANGAHFAEQLSDVQTDLADNRAQFEAMKAAYDNNIQILAETQRQIKQYEMEFERLKAKNAMSEQMKGVASLLKSTNEGLQGVFGGELGRAMDGLRKSAAEGQAQVDATRDLASQIGTGIKYKQVERQARGAALFKEFQAKMKAGADSQVAQVVGATPSATPAATTPEKQKVEV